MHRLRQSPVYRTVHAVQAAGLFWLLRLAGYFVQKELLSQTCGHARTRADGKTCERPLNAVIRLGIVGVVNGSRC